MNLRGRRRGMNEGIDLVEPRHLEGWRGGGYSNTADRQEQVLL
jgi:hypothetical protein